MDSLKDSLRKAIDIVFNNWTGLEIAVRESGNRNSKVILRQLLDTIIEIIWGGIVANGGFDNDLMVDLLVDVLYNQFDTICEDNSAEEIVALMNKMANCIIIGEDPLRLPEIQGLRQSEKWIMEHAPASSISGVSSVPVAAPAAAAQAGAEPADDENGQWHLFARDVAAQLVALRIDEPPTAQEDHAIGPEGGQIEADADNELDEEDDSDDDNSSAFVGAGEGAGRASAAQAIRAGIAATVAEQDAEGEPGIFIGAGEAIVPSDAEEAASSDGEGFHPVTPVSSSSEESDDVPVGGKAQGGPVPQNPSAAEGIQKESTHGGISKPARTPEEMAKEMNVIFMRNAAPKRKKRTYHRYTPTVMDQTLASVSGGHASDVSAASFSGAAGTSASFEAPDRAQGNADDAAYQAPDDAQDRLLAPVDEAMDGMEGNNEQDDSGWEDVKARKRK